MKNKYFAYLLALIVLMLTIKATMAQYHPFKNELGNLPNHLMKNKPEFSLSLSQKFKKTKF
jgi:hypothetical protein